MMDIDNNPIETCDAYEPLLSAMIDNELSVDEQKQLDGHLEQCMGCRSQAAVFQELCDSLSQHQPPVWRQFGTGRGPAFTREDEATSKTLEPKSNAKPSEKGWSLRNGLLLSGATAAALFLSAWGFPDRPVSGQSTKHAEAIAEPLAKLTWLNQESQKDQAQMAKALEYELRTLRLEVQLLGPKETSPKADQKRALLEQIDQLLIGVKDVVAAN